MNDIAIKRRLAVATQTIVKKRDPDVADIGALINVIGELLSVWTGESVRVQITSAGQHEGLDMEKAHKAN